MKTTITIARVNSNNPDINGLIDIIVNDKNWSNRSFTIRMKPEDFAHAITGKVSECDVKSSLE